MGKLRYVPTTEEHVRHVAQNMRQCDIEEIRACSGRDPLVALSDSVAKADEVLTGVDPDDTPVFIFGLTARCRLTGTGAPWMLGTDNVAKFPREMMVDSRKIIGFMLDNFPRLENYVHIKNTVSVNWLKSVGFKMDEPFVAPLSGEQFMRFYMNKEQSNV